MNFFSVESSLALSGTANTRSVPIGLKNGTTRMIAIYQLICGQNVSGAPLNYQAIVEINGTSTLLTTSGTTITPSNLDSSGSASTVTAYQAPSTYTNSPSNPYLHIAFNSLNTVTWMAYDNDQRIFFPAGANAAGCAVVSNQTPQTSSGLTLDNNLFWAE